MFRSDLLDISTEKIPWPNDTEPDTDSGKEAGELTDEEIDKPAYKSPVCRYYNIYGFCKKGDTCPFTHQKMQTANIWKNSKSTSTRKSVNVNDPPLKGTVKVNDSKLKKTVNVNDCDAKTAVKVNDCCLPIMKENNFLKARIDNLELELKNLKLKFSDKPGTCKVPVENNDKFDFSTFKNDIALLESGTSKVPENKGDTCSVSPKRIVQSLAVKGNRKFGGRITTQFDEERRLALKKEGKRRRNREYKQRKAIKNYIAPHDINRKIGSINL